MSLPSSCSTLVFRGPQEFASCLKKRLLEPFLSGLAASALPSCHVGGVITPTSLTHTESCTWEVTRLQLFVLYPPLVAPALRVSERARTSDMPVFAFSPSEGRAFPSQQHTASVQAPSSCAAQGRSHQGCGHTPALASAHEERLTTFPRRRNAVTERGGALRARLKHEQETHETQDLTRLGTAGRGYPRWDHQGGH